MFSKKHTLYIIAFLLLLLCGCSAASAETGDASSTAAKGTPSFSENEVSDDTDSQEGEFSAVFHGKVLEVNSDFGGILVEPEDTEMPSPLVVHSEDMPKLSVGDRIKVEYSGQIALSYPGQIFGARVTLANE